MQAHLLEVEKARPSVLQEFEFPALAGREYMRIGEIEGERGDEDEVIRQCPEIDSRFGNYPEIFEFDMLLACNR